MSLGEKIKEARTKKGYTQKQLAADLTLKGRKTSNTAIANWESGLNSPDIDTLFLLCQLLDKDGNYFFEEIENTSFTINDISLNELVNFQEEFIQYKKEKELQLFKEFLKHKKIK